MDAGLLRQSVSSVPVGLRSGGDVRGEPSKVEMQHATDVPSSVSAQERGRELQGVRLASIKRVDAPIASDVRKLPQALKQAVSSLWTRMQEGIASQADVQDVADKATKAGEDARGLLVDMSA